MSRKILLINQTIGPLFNDFVEEVASVDLDTKIIVYTGNPPTTLSCSNITYESSIPYDNSTSFKRLLTWTQFSIMVFFYLLKRPNLTEVTVCSNPPIALYSVILLKLMGRKLKINFLSYDIYPEVLSSRYRRISKSIFFRLWLRLDQYVLSKVEKVLVISEPMKKTYQMRPKANRNSGSDIEVIPLTGRPIELEVNEIRQARKRLSIKSGEIVFLYTGNFGSGHDFNTILMAIKQAQSSNHKYIFIGDGFHLTSILEAAKFSANIERLPYLDETEYQLYLLASDFCFVTLLPEAATTMVPSKTVSYAMSGSKIISIAPEKSGLAKLIEKNDLGVNIPNGDVDKLVEFLHHCKNTVKTNRTNFCAKNIFGRERLEKLMRKIYYEK